MTISAAHVNACVIVLPMLNNPDRLMASALTANVARICKRRNQIRVSGQPAVSVASGGWNCQPMSHGK